MDTLAVAYAAAGQFDDAAETAEQAVAILISSHQNEKAAQIRERLEGYQAGRPYRKNPTPPGS